MKTIEELKVGDVVIGSFTVNGKEVYHIEYTVTEKPITGYKIQPIIKFAVVDIK